jgi:hypothetical protein
VTGARDVVDSSLIIVVVNGVVRDGSDVIVVTSDVTDGCCVVADGTGDIVED